MNPFNFITLGIYFLLSFNYSEAQSKCSQIKYPETFRNNDTTEVFNGVKLEYPYKWMEQEASSSSIQDFIRVQSNFTNKYLGNCANGDKYLEEFEKVGNKVYTTHDNVQKFGDKYIYTETVDFTNKSYYIQDSEKGIQKLGFEPKKISPNATFALKYNYTQSKLWVLKFDRNKDGYAFLESVDILMEHSSEKNYPEQIEWLKDSSGFFYVSAQSDYERIGSLPETNFVKFHKLGTTLKDTILIEINQTNENFCVPGEKCYISQMTLANDDSCLYLVTYTPNKLYFFNLIKLNSDGSAGEIIPLKHKTLYNGAYSATDVIWLQQDEFYFINRTMSVPMMTGISIQKAGNKYTTKWRTVFEFGPNDYVFDVQTIDTDKVYLRVAYNIQNYDAIWSNEIRYIRNGSLFFQMEYNSNFGFQKSFGSDPVVLLGINPFIHAQYPQTFFLLNTTNIRNSDSEFLHLKPALFNPQVLSLADIFTYTNKLDGRKRGVDVIKPKIPTGKTIIFLESWFSLQKEHFALAESFGITIVEHKLLKIEDTARHGFKTFNKMDANVENVIDVAEALIKSGATNPNQLFLVAQRSLSALGALVINRIPDLFAGIYISETQRYWKPNYDNSGNNETQNYKKFSPLHTIPENLDNFPALFLQYTNLTNVHEKSFGMEYIAELQLRKKSAATAKKRLKDGCSNDMPILLSDKNVDTLRIEGWPQFCCLLEKLEIN